MTIISILCYCFFIYPHRFNLHNTLLIFETFFNSRKNLTKIISNFCVWKVFIIIFLRRNFLECHWVHVFSHRSYCLGVSCKLEKKLVQNNNYNAICKWGFFVFHWQDILFQISNANRSVTQKILIPNFSCDHLIENDWSKFSIALLKLLAYYLPICIEGSVFVIYQIKHKMFYLNDSTNCKNWIYF